MEYRYHLLKYRGRATRLTCPSCGRAHCFAPYVDVNDRIVGPEYGRCDHESSCGYVKYPPSEREWKPAYSRVYRPGTKAVPIETVRVQEAAPELCTVPMSIVDRSVVMEPKSDFLRFLSTMFDDSTVERVVQEYRIGTTANRDAVFYQIDRKGRCRTGKVMRYNPLTGHRIKDSDAKTPITWVHSLMKQKRMLPENWELTQCLFGEHLLERYPDKPVGLVEAEKTAIIASAMMPKLVWVAVGGKTQLGDKVDVLEGREIIAFPDTDGYDVWKQKCAERPYLNIKVSDLLQTYASEEDCQMGADIADILIRWWKGKHSSGGMPSNPDGSVYENPVMREVMKYISPKNWDKMNMLIEAFDLKLTGVTRISKEKTEDDVTCTVEDKFTC